jgi:hypothetical protein
MNAQQTSTARLIAANDIDISSLATAPRWTRRTASDAEYVTLRIVGTIVLVVLAAGAVFLGWLWSMLSNITIVY